MLLRTRLEELLDILKTPSCQSPYGNSDPYSDSLTRKIDDLKLAISILDKSCME